MLIILALPFTEGAGWCTPELVAEGRRSRGARPVVRDSGGRPMGAISREMALGPAPRPLRAGRAFGAGRGLLRTALLFPRRSTAEEQVEAAGMRTPSPGRAAQEPRRKIGRKPTKPTAAGRRGTGCFVSEWFRGVPCHPHIHSSGREDRQSNDARTCHPRRRAAPGRGSRSADARDLDPLSLRACGAPAGDDKER
jgi:hypothetical protein